MKNFIKNCIISSTLLLCLSFNYMGFSQNLIINDGTALYEKENYPTVEVFMEPEPDDVKKAWKDFLKDRYDIRLRGYGFLVNKEVLSAEGVKFEQVAPERMDVYTRVVEENNMTKMQVFASKGYDINVGRSNDSREYYNLKGIVQNFLVTYLQSYYNEQVEEAHERVTELQDNQENKQAEIKENEEKIAELREENEKLNQEIINTRSEWSQAQEALAAKQEKLDSIIQQLASSNNPVYYNTNYDNK